MKRSSGTPFSALPARRIPKVTLNWALFSSFAESVKNVAPKVTPASAGEAEVIPQGALWRGFLKSQEKLRKVKNDLFHVLPREAVGCR